MEDLLNLELPEITNSRTARGSVSGELVRVYLPLGRRIPTVPRVWQGKVNLREVAGWVIPEILPGPGWLDARARQEFIQWRSQFYWSTTLGCAGAVGNFCGSARERSGIELEALAGVMRDGVGVVQGREILTCEDEIASIRGLFAQEISGWGLLDPERKRILRSCEAGHEGVLFEDESRYVAVEAGELILQGAQREAIAWGELQGERWVGCDLDGDRVELSESNGRLLSLLLLGALSFRILEIPLSSVYAQQLTGLTEALGRARASSEQRLLFTR